MQAATSVHRCGGRRNIPWGTTALFVAALTACGGGGGGGSATTETPAGTGGTTSGAVTIDALQTTLPAFNLQVSDSFTLDQTVSDLTAGGDLAAGWNLKSAAAALRPGMKVAFFGRATGCDSTLIDGPTSAGTDSELATIASRTGVSRTATPSTMRWTPQGVSGSCDSSNATRTGPSWVYVNPSASGGALGLYTQSGPTSEGTTPFLSPLGADGADGNGSNRHIIGTFVGFRRPWWSSTALQPWTDSSSSARVVSAQSVNAYQVATDVSAINQVKQQVIVSVINKACQQNRSAVIGPCQMQYLFNTVTMRGDVTDWEAYSPATQGRIWFDPVQGSTPIVAGLIPTSGKTVVDNESGLALYSSKGGGTQHATFTAQNFDLRVSFDQLVNAVRIIAAKRTDVAVASVTDEQVASVWGTSWNDPSQWVFVAASVGQELYNEAQDSRQIYIGGGIKSLYVGPQ